MPALVHSIKMHRAQAGCFLISAISSANIRKRQIAKFNVWKSKLRRFKMLNRINVSLQRNYYLRSVARAFQLWANLRHEYRTKISFIEKILLN